MEAIFQAADGMLAKDSIFPAIGNHEYHNSCGGDNPPTRPTISTGLSIYLLNHSFDCSGIHFIVLNTPDPNNASGDDPYTSLALARSKETWLSEQLDNDTLLVAFTIHHHSHPGLLQCHQQSESEALGEHLPRR
ncbi:MAG: hypothetical protein PHQ34_07980 [Methanothrix sp.]|nr:hypothetical protein [Methanothrix sp.]